MKGTPNNLGFKTDRLYELRAERIKLERQAKELKSQETLLQNELIGSILEQDLTGARGKVATASINPATVGTVVDWGKVEEYVFEHHAFYLMQRRISNLVYLEALEKQGGIPGIEPTVLNKLSLTRAKK